MTLWNEVSRRFSRVTPRQELRRALFSRAC